MPNGCSRHKSSLSMRRDRKSTRLNSSHRCISYAVFCLKKKKIARVRPGSPEALQLQNVLIAERALSPYLAVGIGPYAEIFTKSQPISAIVLGPQIGIQP